MGEDLRYSRSEVRAAITDAMVDVLNAAKRGDVGDQEAWQAWNRLDDVAMVLGLDTATMLDEAERRAGISVRSL